MVYFCERCGYTTQHTGRFNQHINKKHTCKAIIEDIPIQIIRDNFNINTKNPLSINYDISKKYLCGRCGYKTDSKKYFLGHVNRKKLCSPDILDISINEVIQENGLLDTKYTTHVKDIETISNIYDNKLFNDQIIEENAINIHIIEKNTYERLDLSGINNLIQMDLQTNQNITEHTENNITKLDEIYNNLLKENNITDEDNLDLSTTHHDYLKHNEDIIDIDTCMIDNDNCHENSTFTTTYTGHGDTDDINDFNTYMKEALENNNVNVINKINNIAVHCHGINLDLIQMSDYSIFSSLEPGKYILVMDEKKRQFDTELITKLDF